MWYCTINAFGWYCIDRGASYPPSVEGKKKKREGINSREKFAHHSIDTRLSKLRGG